MPIGNFLLSGNLIKHFISIGLTGGMLSKLHGIFAAWPLTLLGILWLNQTVPSEYECPLFALETKADHRGKDENI